MNRFAFLIGINEYVSVSRLSTPISDINALGTLLKDQFGFTVRLESNVNGNQLKDFFKNKLHEQLDKVPSDSQVLIYFAGHGYAVDDEIGIKGYLIPADGKPSEKATWFSMTEMLLSIERLEIRHTLLILDCCFGGTFRFAGRYRGGSPVALNKLYRQHFVHFAASTSCQVLTSTSPEQEALDFLGYGSEEKHSPFAKLLMQGLSGSADLIKDKIITTAELFTYLQRRLPDITKPTGNPQQVGLFALDKHKNGEFLFAPIDFNLEDLEELKYKNPYKGLNAYEKEDANQFFGRSAAISTLWLHLNTHLLTIVTGASGSGKSSLVKAGIVPLLLQEKKKVQIISPGRYPLSALAQASNFEVLVIDQFEQLITQAQETAEVPFFQAIEAILQEGKKIIVTVRIDLEGQLAIPKDLREIWEAGRIVVPPFSPEELREIIITPALRAGRFFEPPNLVDRIIEEVISYPGALPLLSYTLQQLFEKCKANLYRNIEEVDYIDLGGVIGALQTSADNVFKELEDEDKQKQTTMQHLLLRMVSISGGEMAGKRVLKEELIYDDPAENERIKKVIGILEHQRLIQADKDQEGNEYIQPNHDALIRSWKKVQEWVKAFGEENILLHAKLEAAVEEYQEEGQPISRLWLFNPSRRQVSQAQKKKDKKSIPMVLNSAEYHFYQRSKKWNAGILIGIVVIVLAVIGSLAVLRADAVNNLNKANRLIEFYDFGENELASWAYRDGKFAVINNNGDTLTDFIYESPTMFQSGYSIAKINNQYAVLDQYGVEATNRFDYMISTNNNYYKAGPVNEYQYLGIDASIFLDNQNPDEGLNIFSISRKIDDTNYTIIQNGEWGLIDDSGKIIFEPQFRDISVFNSGIIWGLKNDKFYILNNNHPNLTPREFESYSELALFATGVYPGQISSETAKTILSQYDSVKELSDGLIAVEKNGLWGYVNPSGELVIQPQFVVAHNFDQGFALAQFSEERGIYDGCIIDKSGNCLGDTRDLWIDEISQFKNGKAWVLNEELDESVRGYTFSDHYWGVIDTMGNVMIELQYENYKENQNGFIWVKNAEERGQYGETILESKWGLIDSLGNKIYEHKFDEVSSLVNGSAIVKENGIFKHINIFGKTISIGSNATQVQAVQINQDSTGMVIANSPPQSTNYKFQHVDSTLDEQQAILQAAIYYDTAEQYINLFGLKGENNEVLLEPSYFHIEKHSSRIFLISNDEESIVDYNELENAIDWGLIAISDKVQILVPPLYDEITTYGGYIARLKKNNKFGLINLLNLDSLPCIYSSIQPILDETFLVKQNGLLGMISYRLGINIPPAYEELGLPNEELGWIRAKKDGKWGWLDRQGNIKISLQYDVATPFYNGKAQVAQTPYPTPFPINKKGQMVLE